VVLRGTEAAIPPFSSPFHVRVLPDDSQGGPPKSVSKALYSTEDDIPPGKLPGVERYATMHVNSSQGDADMAGSWNRRARWERVDDFTPMMAVDEGGGPAMGEAAAADRVS